MPWGFTVAGVRVSVLLFVGGMALLSLCIHFVLCHFYISIFLNFYISFYMILHVYMPIFLYDDKIVYLSICLSLSPYVYIYIYILIFIHHSFIYIHSWIHTYICICMKVSCFFDHIEVLGDDFGVISVSCWSHFGLILEACWGHFGVIFGSWGFLGPQEASKRPSGRKTKIFRRMAPAKKSHKLGPFSVQDA